LHGLASFLGTAGLLLCTEDLLPLPVSAGLAIFLWHRRSSSMHRRSPTEAHLCRFRKLSWDCRSSSVHRRSPAYAHLCRSCDLGVAGLLSGLLSAEDPLPTPVSAGLEVFLEIAGLLSMIRLPLQSIFARSSRSAQP